jgi:hypothetical protein
VKICPCCKFADNPYWRHSRFDYNADYMRWEDFQREYAGLAEQLEGRRNNDPIEDYEKINFYYRRGTGGIEVYRVAKEDYKMPRERKSHKGEMKTYDASILDVNDQ